MWRRLQDTFRLLWRRSRSSRAESQVTLDRARFWAEVRRGQQEAEANARPWNDDSERNG